MSSFQTAQGHAFRKLFYAAGAVTVYLICFIGDWYCSDECAIGALEDDPILNHTKSLMWLGLNNTFRRDAVSEGNGPMIITHWKMDVSNFCTHCHPKYLIIAHQLLDSTQCYKLSHLSLIICLNITKYKQDLIFLC